MPLRTLPPAPGQFGLPRVPPLATPTTCRPGVWASRSFVEVDGTVYMPGGGMTTAGTPIHVTMRRNAIMDHLDRLRSHLPEILSELDKQFPPQNPDEAWEPMLDGDTWGLKRGERSGAGRRSLVIVAVLFPSPRSPPSAGGTTAFSLMGVSRSSQRHHCPASLPVR